MHPVRRVIRSLAAVGPGVRWLHLARLAVIGQPRGGRPGSPARQPALQYGRAGFVQVLAHQAQAQVPALRPPVRSLDPRRHDVRVARRDDGRGLQPVQARAHRALRQPGVPNQGGRRRERARAIRPRVVRQAGQHELARARRLAAAIGRDRSKVQRPRDRLDAHRAPPRGARPGRQAAHPGLVSVLVSFTPVRDCSPAARRDPLAQVTDGGGHR